MAINTENRRRSVAVYTPFAAPCPVADGTVGDEDRFFVGWIYAGTDPQQLDLVPDVQGRGLMYTVEGPARLEYTAIETGGDT